MGKPSKCISVSEAKTLQKRWLDTRAKEIEAAEGAEDASDFTYSLSDLEEFVQYVREESTKQGIDNPGVRIYFAAYDNAKSKKATVFLAPTMGPEADSDNNYNIDPMDRSGTGWPPNKYE